ncbi:hypothetical protein VNO77_27320 [Canavalia gladiata]|uniref:Uncharacterized protein n=1 Tax=Canavalia gladiata TaxID=3824 RepID=A0AAN9Q428_CANGL
METDLEKLKHKERPNLCAKCFLNIVQLPLVALTFILFCKVKGASIRNQGNRRHSLQRKRPSSRDRPHSQIRAPTPDDHASRVDKDRDRGHGHKEPSNHREPPRHRTYRIRNNKDISRISSRDSLEDKS